MTLDILFLTAQWPHPPRTGAALRNHGLISGLVARQRVSVLSLLDVGQSDPTTEGQADPLVSICRRVQCLPAPLRPPSERLRNLLAGQADMARRLWSEEYAVALTDMLAAERYDVIHIGGLEMAPYLEVIKRNGFEGMVVFDNYNAESALQRRIFEIDLSNPRRWHAAAYSLLQWRRLIAFETSVCRRASQVLAVSQPDAELLRDLKHTTPVAVVPNAIEVAAYTVNNTVPGLLPSPTLVFTGKMDYRPNVDAALWFVSSILPLIQKEIPEAHFAIVGQKPHARLETLRQRIDVTLTGEVEDIRPYIAAADVYVAPMRMGSGTRFKLLEAMAMKRPTVSTALGAQGLDAQAGRHFVLADRPDAFAAAVVGLLSDVQRRASLGQEAHDFVKAYYDWKNIIPRVEAVYYESA